MHMDKKSYARYVEARAPRSPILKNCLWAFLVGGGICLFAEGLNQIFTRALGMTQENAATTTSILLVLIAVTLTALGLFDRIANPRLLVRRVTLTVARVIREEEARREVTAGEQLDMFSDPEEIEREQKAEEAALKRERARQETIIELRRRYGKNAVLKGMNYEEGATTKDRNHQIGGHKA